jgi:hypothetical protein
MINISGWAGDVSGKTRRDPTPANVTDTAIHFQKRNIKCPWVFGKCREKRLV